MSVRTISPISEPTESAAHHAERLATHGALLDAWLGRSALIPPRWRTPYFARVVELVRSHLQPIVSRDLLALSYAREQFHVIAIGRPPEPPTLLARDATEVAYALRWLELGSSKRSASWSSLIGID